MFDNATMVLTSCLVDTSIGSRARHGNNLHFLCPPLVKFLQWKRLILQIQFFMVQVLQTTKKKFNGRGIFWCSAECLNSFLNCVHRTNFKIRILAEHNISTEKNVMVSYLYAG